MGDVQRRAQKEASDAGSSTSRAMPQPMRTGAERMSRARVVVSGHVQGVWYRQSCRDVAVAAGVQGWVRNKADGTVEAVLEGEPEAVERVLTWMRVGPSRAVVADVRVTHEPPEQESSFVVR